MAKLILKTMELGYAVKIQELNRTVETQAAYVEKGVSKTMDSRHLDRLAADLVLFKEGMLVLDPEAFRPLGEFWESLGGRWGGRFGLEDKSKAVQDQKIGWDAPHFEFKK